MKGLMLGCASLFKIALPIKEYLVIQYHELCREAQYDFPARHRCNSPKTSKWGAKHDHCEAHCTQPQYNILLAPRIHRILLLWEANVNTIQ
jgi:hypothetical protein